MCLQLMEYRTPDAPHNAPIYLRPEVGAAKVVAVFGSWFVDSHSRLPCGCRIRCMEPSVMSCR